MISDVIKWLKCTHSHIYILVGGWNSFGWLLRLRRPSIGHTTCPRWWIPMSSPSHRWDGNSMTWTPYRSLSQDKIEGEYLQVTKSIPISLFTLGWYVVIHASRVLAAYPSSFSFSHPIVLPFLSAWVHPAHRTFLRSQSQSSLQRWMSSHSLTAWAIARTFLQMLLRAELAWRK